MTRSSSTNARIRRKANLRFRKFIIASSVICASAVALFAYLSFRPQTLRIAAETADLKVIENMARLFSEDRSRIRIAPMVRNGSLEAVESLRRGEADIAIVRSDSYSGSEAQSVAVFRKNFIIAWTSGSPGKRVKSTPKLQDLAGHVRLVASRSLSDKGVIESVLVETGVAPSDVRIEDHDASALSGVERNRPKLFMAVSTLKSKATIAAIEEIAKQQGEPTFLGIDASDAISKTQPSFEADEIPSGIFRRSPAWPQEKVDTLSVNDLMLARSALSEDIVTAFTRKLFSIRNRLINDFPGIVDIEKPNTDKDAAIPAHRGAAAFIDGTERTFLERYSDVIWGAVLLISVLGSAGAWLRAYIKRDQRTNNAALRARLLRMTNQVRASKSLGDIEKMRLDVDDIVSDTLHCYEDGAIDEGDLSVFSMMLARFQQTASDTRLELLLAPKD